VTAWDADAICERLDRMADNSLATSVFGFAGHKFRRFPPLSDDEVQRIEESYRFEFPPDFRSFMTNVENGGAGPGYGLFPLGQYGDSASETKPWIDGWGDPSKPFLLTDRWNLADDLLSPPDGLAEPEMDAWFEVKDAQYFDEALVDGTIPGAHLGCAMWFRLVVNGPFRGEVWLDDRTSDKGIYPLDPRSFGGWYLDWLGEAEEQVASLRLA
jgi:hypothetical protein